MKRGKDPVIGDTGKTVGEMIGEFFREAGVLILVFAPLYVFFEGSKASRGVIAITLGIGLASLMAGVALERNRP
jgi:hypothetical protein